MKMLMRPNIKEIALMASLAVPFTVLMIVCAMLTAAIEAQERKNATKTLADSKSCVRLLIASNSNRLEKSKPNQLHVTIENRCEGAIEVIEPTFTIDKTNLSDPVKFGDRRVGRIVRNSEIDNTVKAIEPNNRLEFTLDFGEIRWVDSMSSVEVFENLFIDHQLKAGSYNLYCSIFLKHFSVQSNDECEQREVRVLSNTIELRFDRE